MKAGRIKKQSYKMATTSTKEEDSDGSDKVEARRTGCVVHLVSPYDPPPSSTPEEASQDQVSELAEAEEKTTNSMDQKQNRQQRVFNMMKNLQQFHLEDLMQTEMVGRESLDMSETQCICRICHSAGEEPLVTPCQCAGSAKYVHAHCLLTWFKKAVKNTCELCRCKVAIKKKSKPLAEWRKPEDKPIPVIWFLVFLIGLFLNVFSISVNASELCTTTACVIFYVVNGFGVVLDAAFLYFWWTKCLFYWKKWCALNQDWSIASCPLQATAERPNEERSLRTLQISDIV
ncbi:E3 ubiquitin-protein ligase MARCH8-like isoform X2 [Actinia tenebrosa]|nr:E3 ubiquitin-protein ligase MARCH8-like isoform X2 [Actinia tenebrosa]